MATLTVSHYIYLTREERYKLHAGEALEVVGISVPVWFSKGNTSEPARELFCKYKLSNDPKNRPLTKMLDGYDINLPQNIEVEGFPEGVVPEFGTSQLLLDIKDGGAEWLEFRQFGKMENSEEYNIVHFIEIKTIELLMDTLS